MSSCYECGGTGECPSCHGTGVGLTQKCIICRGAGACQACNPGGLVAPTVNTSKAQWTRRYRRVAYAITFLLVCFAGLHRMGTRNQTPNQIKQLATDCDSGSAASCTELGRIFSNGENVPKNDALASRLYAKACSMREAVACFNLASRNAAGRGLPKQPNQAAALYALSCHLDYSDGCVKAAEMYSHGTDGIAQDPNKAFELYGLGCAHGNQQSCSMARSRIPIQKPVANLPSTSANKYQLPSTPKLASAKPARAFVVEPQRQAELRQLAQSVDQRSIWTGYPNCNVILNFLTVTPSPASLDTVDSVPCGESLEVLRNENKFYLVRTRRSILGYVVANAVSSTQ